MSSIETLKATLYNEDFWLPENVTWKDLESTPEMRFPQGADLMIPLAIAPLMLLIRYIIKPENQKHIVPKQSNKHIDQ